MLFLFLGRSYTRRSQRRRNRRSGSWRSDHVQLQVRQGLPGAKCGALPGEQRGPASPDRPLPAHHGLRLLEVWEDWRYRHVWPLLQVSSHIHDQPGRQYPKRLNSGRIPSKESLPSSPVLVTASSCWRTSTTARQTSRISALSSPTLSRRSSTSSCSRSVPRTWPFTRLQRVPSCFQKFHFSGSQVRHHHQDPDQVFLPWSIIFQVLWLLSSCWRQHSWHWWTSPPWSPPTPPGTGSLLARTSSCWSLASGELRVLMEVSLRQNTPT